jgi:hypothetical protein
VNRADLGGLRRLRLDQVRQVVLRSGIVAARIASQVGRGRAAHVLGRHQPIFLLFLEVDALSRLCGRRRGLRASLLEIQERVETPSSPRHTAN